jgi:hypothetical protein
VKRTIFVGSSHEGFAEAQRVCEVIKGIGDESLDPQLWTTFFNAGSLTFEALEEMLQQCCAAVFVIRRDDLVRHVDASGHATGREKLFMPRGNVLLEFGLVAGRLGRRNVALCRMEKADVPSDLAGMTVIDMCPGCQTVPEVEKQKLEDDVRIKFKRWAAQLKATASDIERTAIFHGYTGRWQFELGLKKWRGVPISTEGSYVVVTGSLDLFIGPDGGGSFGSLFGTLSCRLEGKPPYLADYNIVHSLSNIECNQDGGMVLTSHLQSLGKVHGSSQAPAELTSIGSGSEPWTFTWKLTPDESGQLNGTLCTSGSGGTLGEVTATKLRMIR